MGLMRITTKRGDGGATDLGNGERVAKFDLRVEAYGTLDELSACLGMARAAADSTSLENSQANSPGGTPPDFRLPQRLLEIQQNLSVLSGWLATPGSAFPEEAAGASALQKLEAEIDFLMEQAGPLRGFVMPGRSQLEASLHLARTVCRRAERRVAELSFREKDASCPPEGSGLSPALRFLNRLSDWLFAASRIG